MHIKWMFFIQTSVFLEHFMLPRCWCWCCCCCCHAQNFFDVVMATLWNKCIPYQMMRFKEAYSETFSNINIALKPYMFYRYTNIPDTEFIFLNDVSNVPPSNLFFKQTTAKIVDCYCVLTVLRSYLLPFLHLIKFFNFINPFPALHLYFPAFHSALVSAIE